MRNPVCLSVCCSGALRVWQLEAGLDGFAYYLTDPPHLDCAGLSAALEGSGIECPSLDKDLVAVYASTLASGRE